MQAIPKQFIADVIAVVQEIGPVSELISKFNKPVIIFVSTVLRTLTDNLDRQTGAHDRRPIQLLGPLDSVGKVR